MSCDLRRAAAVAAATLVASAASVPSAHADVATFPDVGDHISSVQVKHGPHTIRVTAFDAEMAQNMFYRFWLDTDSSDPGPEYMTEVYPDSGRSTLQRVDDFASYGTTIECDGYRITASVDGPEYARIVVPRSCVGTPSLVRVSVTGFYDENPAVVDWAPGEERFYPWVNR